MQPTYEELEAALKDTQGRLAETLKLLKIALEEIARLKEQIGKNSKNSSKAPSTDQKGNTNNDDHKKERKGRPGKARTLVPPERVNNHVTCTLENCPHCGSASIQPGNQPPEVLQQAELPEVQAIITEYSLTKYGCMACGKNSVANLPIGIPDSAFGPKLMGLLATLTGIFHLAKREAVQLIKDLYGVDIGVGSVPNIEERVANALDPVYHRIHHFVINSKVCKHFDETGWRDRGLRHFVWLASCKDAAVYMIDRRRNTEAFEKLVGKAPEGLPSVTDRYALYERVGKVHQYCLAHLIRDFRLYSERDGPDKEIGEAIKTELKTVCHIQGEYREGRLTLEQRDEQLAHCKRQVEFWLEDGFANGSDELHKLCDTMLTNFDKLWTFMKVSDMDPTNNLAERDLRKLVVWRKKSYGTKSDRGKRFVERITTVSQTLRKQAMNVLSFIQDLVACFYRGAASPLISEAMGF